MSGTKIRATLGVKWATYVNTELCTLFMAQTLTAGNTYSYEELVYNDIEDINIFWIKFKKQLLISDLCNSTLNAERNKSWNFESCLFIGNARLVYLQFCGNYKEKNSWGYHELSSATSLSKYYFYLTLDLLPRSFYIVVRGSRDLQWPIYRFTFKSDNCSFLSCNNCLKVVTVPPLVPFIA